MSDLKSKYSLTTAQLVFLCVLIVALSVGFFFNLYATITRDTITYRWLLSSVVVLLMFIYTLYYLFAGYKVPHGNTMKHLFFAFAITLAVQVFTNNKSQRIYDIFYLACTVIVAYEAGRLTKKNETKILFPIVTAMLLIIAVISVCGDAEHDIYLIIRTVAGRTGDRAGRAARATRVEIVNIPKFILNYMKFNYVILWTTMVAAYLSRYNLHKEAGFAEKK